MRPWRTVVLENVTVAQVLENYPPSVEYEDIEPGSASRPCLQTDESNPHSDTHFLKIHLSILSAMLWSHKWFLQSGFSSKILYAFLISLMQAIYLSHITFFDLSP
jgi:hypothetical protein